MTTPILDSVLQSLRQSKLTDQQVAEATGIPLGTLKKIKLGYTRNPGVLHVQRLADYFATSAHASQAVATQRPGAAPAAARGEVRDAA